MSLYKDPSAFLPEPVLGELSTDEWIAIACRLAMNDSAPSICPNNGITVAEAGYELARAMMAGVGVAEAGKAYEQALARLHADFLRKCLDIKPLLVKESGSHE